MNKLFFTVVFIVQAIVALAQPTVSNKSEVVGKNLITGNQIKAIQYQFSDQIYSSYLDSVSQTLTLQLRGTSTDGKYFTDRGDLAVVDLKSTTIKWSMFIDYKQMNVRQLDDLLIAKIENNVSTRYDINTGNELWNTKVVMCSILPGCNIALGYKYNAFLSSYADNMSCIDLTTGAVRWSKYIDKSYGFDGVVQLSDTSLIIKSAGLHYVNTNTGKGWDYKAVTGVKDYSKNTGVNIAGTVLGLFTGTFVYSTGYDLLSNLISNVVVDSSYYYFASKESLVCLTHDGVVDWELDLPRTTSHSYLFTDSANVYLVNYGDAEYKGKTIVDGKPYVAAFNKTTGAQLYLKKLDYDKDPIQEIAINADTVNLFLKDRVVQFSLKTALMRTTIYADENISDFEYVVGASNAYVMADSTYKSLRQLDSQAVYLKCNGNEVKQLNKNLSVEKTFSSIDFYSLRASTPAWTFIYKNNTVMVLNNANKAVAELYVGKKMFVINNKLYCIGIDCVTIVDLATSFN